MNDENTSPEEAAHQQQTWPRSLNKVLIGVGVLVFGFIIADRVTDMFRAEDMPDIAVTVPDTGVVSAVVVKPEQVDVQEKATVLAVEPEEALDIEDVFGSRLVFVSTSEPLYVLTEDDRRFDVGSDIDDETTLAGITGQRVILEKDGDLLVIRLHEPAVQ